MIDSAVCATAVFFHRSHFTGKERDAESGNDYFEARYYGSSMGRFMSPDEPFADFDPNNPQSWNLYGYVRNNPLTNTDPDGNSVRVCDNNGQCNTVENNVYTAAQQGNNNGMNVPTLDQVGMNGNGSGQFNSTAITDANGNQIGTATYVSDGPTDYYANRTGINQLALTGATVGPIAGAEMAVISAVMPGMFAAGAAPVALGIVQGAEDTVAIGKVADLNKGLKPGERKLDLPDQGNPKGNWAQNSGRLRQAMSEGKPIHDVSAGSPGSNTGFLRAERNLLQSHGWTLKGEYWVPPGR
jgi:RHS repeat-associated protein